MIDEPLTHLDLSGRNRAGLLLRKLLVRGEDIGGIGSSGICAGTIILILQDLAADELEVAFDHIDDVVKYLEYWSTMVSAQYLYVLKPQYHRTVPTCQSDNGTVV